MNIQVRSLTNVSFVIKSLIPKLILTVHTRLHTLHNAIHFLILMSLMALWSHLSRKKQPNDITTKKADNNTSENIELHMAR